MCRCDFNNTRTKFHINITVGNYRYLSVNYRKNYRLTYVILISVIIRVNCHSSISEHCLRSCGSHLYISAAIGKRIAQMPEMSCLLLILNLSIRERCMTARTPVDNSLASVYKSLVIEIYEYFFNCFGTSLVHCETLSVPICG